MIEHTHNLEQYSILHGKRLFFYKRPKPVGKQKYTAPRFIGIRNFRCKADALEFKKTFDKPLTTH